MVLLVLVESLPFLSWLRVSTALQMQKYHKETAVLGFWVSELWRLSILEFQGFVVADDETAHA